MEKSHKTESDYQGYRWTMRFLWKEGTQTTDISHLLSAVCGETALAPAAGHERYLGTPKEWFHEASRKLPRRWQR